MNKVFAVAAALALLIPGGIAQADVFDLGTDPAPVFTNLETVAVGDPGNSGELSGAGAGGYGPDRICGSVGYNYKIGKYEVTAKQYTDFLNKVAKIDPYGLYATDMWNSNGCGIERTGPSDNFSYSVANDYANRPVNWVTYWDCCRFVNWLHNGQPTGFQDASTTERGVYTLDGYMGIGGRTIQRNAGWKWAVTSEDEWYKAAYYRGGGTSAGYWDYATSSSAAPGRDMADGSGNNANYETTDYLIGSPYYRTEVGEFQNSDSPYGTFDQCGNIWEWNEGLIFDTNDFRGLRGGAFTSYLTTLQASFRYNLTPKDARSFVGFRVSEVVPAYGISNRAAHHPIISTAAARFNFKVWGEVTNLVSGNSFTVDDGSGAPVDVVAPGFSGIQNGDYASAQGGLSGEGPSRVLNAQASDVVKLD